MEINRNQYFMAGLVILLLGLQFRYVDSFVLNERCSDLLEHRLIDPQTASIQATPTFFASASASLPSLRRVKPPRWLGWAMLSVGGVLIFHSFGMKRPD